MRFVDLGTGLGVLPRQLNCRRLFDEFAPALDLYYTDRNLRFHNYHAGPATEHVGDLLAEIDRDPAGIFWG